jgi:hypothetical protein
MTELIDMLLRFLPAFMFVPKPGEGQDVPVWPRVTIACVGILGVCAVWYLVRVYPVQGKVIP